MAFSEINNNLLLIEAKLYPKMIMLTNGFYEKKRINIAILTDKKTKRYAIEFKNLLQNPKFNVKITTKPNLNYDVYVLTYNIDAKIIKKLIKQKKLIFSIDPDLINKSMFSIYIGIRVYPLINPYLIKKADIRVNPVIFKVAKIYEK